MVNDEASPSGPAAELSSDLCVCTLLGVSHTRLARQEPDLQLAQGSGWRFRNVQVQGAWFGAFSCFIGPLCLAIICPTTQQLLWVCRTLACGTNQDAPQQVRRAAATAAAFQQLIEASRSDSQHQCATRTQGPVLDSHLHCSLACCSAVRPARRSAVIRAASNPAAGVSKAVSARGSCSLGVLCHCSLHTAGASSTECPACNMHCSIEKHVTSSSVCNLDRNVSRGRRCGQ